MGKIIINTGNPNKQKEIKKILGNKNNIKFLEYDLPEIDSKNPLEIVIYKTKLLKELVGKINKEDILVTEDVTFKVNGNFVPDIKWRINELKQNDKIEMFFSIGIYDAKEKIFKAYKKTLTGKIDLKQPKNFNFGFDNIFIVKGKQFGEYKKENNPRILYKEIINELIMARNYEIISKVPDLSFPENSLSKWYFYWQEKNKTHIIVKTKSGKNILKFNKNDFVDTKDNKKLKAEELEKNMKIKISENEYAKILDVVDISNRIQKPLKYENKTPYNNYRLFSYTRLLENIFSPLPLEIIYKLKLLNEPGNAKKITKTDVKKYSKNLLVNTKTKEIINISKLTKNTKIGLNVVGFVPLEICFMKKNENNKSTIKKIVKIFKDYYNTEIDNKKEINEEELTNLFFYYMEKFDLNNTKIISKKELGKLLKQGYKDITNELKVEAHIYNNEINKIYAQNNEFSTELK